MISIPLGLVQDGRKIRKGRFRILAGVLVRFPLPKKFSLINPWHFFIFKKDVILVQEWKLPNWKLRSSSLLCLLVSSSTLLTSMVNVQRNFPSRTEMISNRSVHYYYLFIFILLRVDFWLLTICVLQTRPLGDPCYLQFKRIVEWYVAWNYHVIDLDDIPILPNLFSYHV